MNPRIERFCRGVILKNVKEARKHSLGLYGADCQPLSVRPGRNLVVNILRDSAAAFFFFPI